MLIRSLLILVLLTQPLVSAAQWVCACLDESIPVAHSCCSIEPGAAANDRETCSCGCGDDSSASIAQSNPGCDSGHLADCSTILGRDCSGCECTLRTELPNAPIPNRVRQVSTDHATLPLPPISRTAAPVFGFERVCAPRQQAASWLARCPTSNDRRVALSSWTI